MQKMNNTKRQEQYAKEDFIFNNLPKYFSTYCDLKDNSSVKMDTLLEHCLSYLRPLNPNIEISKGDIDSVISGDSIHGVKFKIRKKNGKSSIYYKNITLLSDPIYSKRAPNKPKITRLSKHIQSNIILNNYAEYYIQSKRLNPDLFWEIIDGKLQSKLRNPPPPENIRFVVSYNCDNTALDYEDSNKLNERFLDMYQTIVKMYIDVVQKHKEKTKQTFLGDNIEKRLVDNSIIRPPTTIPKATDSLEDKMAYSDQFIKYVNQYNLSS